MRQPTSRARAGTGAAKKVWLISDATLLALHRKLLAAVARQNRNGNAGTREGIEQYAAAKVAVWFDLNAKDAVVPDGEGPMEDALAVARKIKARKNRRVVLAWAGEGGRKWQEELEAARAESLSMIFVGAAGSVQLPRVNGKLKPGEEMPCITVDGHDVVAAYRVAHEAIERARRDRGPTLILLATYRVGGRAFTDAVADMDRYLRGRGLLKRGTKGQREWENRTRGQANIEL